MADVAHQPKPCEDDYTAPIRAQGVSNGEINAAGAFMRDLERVPPTVVALMLSLMLSSASKGGRTGCTEKPSAVTTKAEVSPAPDNPPKNFTEIVCPCCKKPSGVPELNFIIDYYRVPKLQAAILTAVWRGKGFPVANERIYDLMYADDPDGGPSPGRMAASLKEQLFHLRGRLHGSGVSIETVGYRRGFRLVLSEAEGV